MSESKYSLEKMYEIWNDKTGYCIQVGPDRDGLDLIEIRLKDSMGKVLNGVTFSKEEASLVAYALKRALETEVLGEQNDRSN